MEEDGKDDAGAADPVVVGEVSGMGDLCSLHFASDRQQLEVLCHQMAGLALCMSG